MRRSHRTGAASVATAGLLIGAAVTLAALHGAPPAEVKSSTRVGEPTDPDLAALSASAGRLQREAAALKAELAHRSKADDSAEPSRADRSTGSDDDPTAGPSRSAAATGRPSTPAAAPTTSAPATDVTTGASGAAGGDDRGDDDSDPGDGDD